MMNKTVIVFATDQKYKYYTAVTIQSILDHISPEGEYMITVLHEDLSPEEVDFFHSLTKPYKNVTLHPVCMADWINKIGREQFYIGSRYPIAAYYRLFLPEILPDADKVIYLDSDMLVRTDIAKLLQTDLHGCALGAVRDKQAASSIFLSPDQLKLYLYCRKSLRLKSSRNYLNSGMLVMDLALMRKTGFKQKVSETLASGIQFLLVDQDIFNLIYKNDYYKISSLWNDQMYEVRRDHSKSFIQHFSGLAPWASPLNRYAGIWRDYAATLPFYRDMESTMNASRLKHLENMEKEYHILTASTCWKMIFPVRLILIYLKLLLDLFRK